MGSVRLNILYLEAKVPKLLQAVKNPHVLEVGKKISPQLFVIKFMNWKRWNREHADLFEPGVNCVNGLYGFLCCPRHFQRFVERESFKAYGLSLYGRSTYLPLTPRWFEELELGVVGVLLPGEFMEVCFA